MRADDEAIERVYRERYAGFRTSLLAVTGSEEAARDAVQEAFARALAGRDRFRGGSLEAWIWQTALRCALDQRRTDRRVEIGRLIDAADPRLPAPRRDPALAHAIRALSPRRRLVVFLRYFADFSYAEIAQACEISEGAVGAALTQARAALEDTLALEAGHDDR